MLVALAQLPRQEVATVAWRTDFEAARREAQEKKKPLFVVFRCER